MFRRFVLAFIASLFCASAAYAQFPPQKAKNLKVLPADMPIRAVLDTMRTFAGALGVRCTYCHVGEEGQPLSSFDFASDEKPTKTKARVMMQMMSAINTDYLTKLASRRQPPIIVGCMTCHRGVAEPRPLQQVVLNAYDVAGTDSAIATYRALRQKYYGRSAYDFGEGTLVSVGGALRARNKLADALRFYMLNLEFTPTSAFTLKSVADAQLASGDTVGAIASLEKAIVADPNDQQAKTTLEGLKRKK